MSDLVVVENGRGDLRRGCRVFCGDFAMARLYIYMCVCVCVQLNDA